MQLQQYMLSSQNQALTSGDGCLGCSLAGNHGLQSYTNQCLPYTSYTTRDHLVCQHHRLQQCEARRNMISFNVTTMRWHKICMQVMSLQPTTTGKQRSRRPLPLWVKLPCWQALRGSTASGPVDIGNHCITVRLHCIIASVSSMAKTLCQCMLFLTLVKIERFGFL